MTHYRPLANPERLAALTAASVLEPPPPVDLVRFAAEKVRFGAESPFPGPYDHDKFPFFKRLLEVCSPDHPASKVSISKGAQLGGTVLAQILVAAILDMAPCQVLYVHPNDGNAKKWLRSKFRPMLKASSALATLMKPEGSRTGYSALYWERRDERGSVQMASAQSPTQLSMMSYPIQIQDDLAKWEGDNGAGDPEQQADSRTKAFLRFGGKIIKISTPLVEPGCRITRAYNQGTRETYHVPCPHCDHYQPLEWDNMRETIDPAAPDDAHFTCAACGDAIREHHRHRINLQGRWVAERPEAWDVSFYIWSAYSPLESWGNIARAWLAAKGNPQAEQVFANDTVGRAYHVSSAAPPWEGLRDRAEAMSLPRGVIPAGFLLLTVGVDCQADRIEWQAVAYGPQMRRCVVDVGVIDHAVTDTEGQKRLGALLDRTWPDTFGNRREFDLMGVDANAYTQDVHAWHKKLGTRKGRVLLVRGRHGDNAPILERVKFERKPDGTTVRAQKKWYNVGVSVLKNSLYAHLKKDDPSEMGAVLFVRDLGDEYFQQLTSEVRKKVKTSVGEVYRWVLPSGARNEALDTHNYATACAIRLRWAVMPDDDWARMAERMEVPLEPQGDLFGGGIAPVPPAPAAAPQPGEAEPPDAEPKKTSGRPSWMERMAALNRST